MSDIRDFKIGDERGRHKLVWKSPDLEYQIWVTKNGKYTIIGAAVDYVAKFNIMELEDAISFCEGLCGNETKLQKIRVKKANDQKNMEIIEEKIVERKFGDVVGKRWTYLGGSQKYEVWCLNQRKFQITTKYPEVAVTSTMTAKRLFDVIQKKNEIEGENFSYQIPMDVVIPKKEE